MFINYYENQYDSTNVAESSSAKYLIPKYKTIIIPLFPIYPYAPYVQQFSTSS